MGRETFIFSINCLVLLMRRLYVLFICIASSTCLLIQSILQRTQLRLKSADQFNYLSHTDCLEIEGINDADVFRKTTLAMNVIGLSEKVTTLISYLPRYCKFN